MAEVEGKVETPVVETPVVETPTLEMPSEADQISDMLASFGEEPAPVEEPNKEPETDPKPDDTASPAKNEPPEELSPQDKRIKELEDKLAELLASKEKPVEKTPEQEALDEEGYFKQQIDSVQKDLAAEYLDDEAYEQVFEKREKLNELLKKVQTDTLQGVFRSIPKIIATLIPHHINFYNKTAEFYKNNPDLMEHRKVVGQTIDELSAKNPGWDIDKLMEAVGGKDDDIGEVRKKLGLKKQAVKAAERENIKRPSFAKPSHVKQPGKEVTLQGLDKEIDEMIKANT